MSKKEVIKPVLENLYKVGFASPYNFIPYITNNAKNLKSSEGWPRDVFKRLLAQQLIREIPVYGRIYKPTFKNRFYTITDKGCKAIGKPRVYLDPRSFNHLDHEFGLIDILLGFIYNYPSYEVEINRNFVFKDLKYKPDAYIRMTSLDGKVYDFILEFERTRSWRQIREEKFKYKNILPQKYNLSYHTNFLYVYTWERFNVYLRPIEYNLHIQEIETTNRFFNRLTKFNKKIPDTFLFCRLHELIANKNNTTWYDVKLQPRKLIQ